jgi:hypothetical protein
VLQRIPVQADSDACCLVDPRALDPEVRTLSDHLALSRDLLIALADPLRQEQGSCACASKVARCTTA